MVSFITLFIRAEIHLEHFFVYAGIHLPSANKLYGLLNNRIMKEVKQTRRDNCCVGYVNNPKDLPQHLSKSW